jgi:hypothetical protein
MVSIEKVMDGGERQRKSREEVRHNGQVMRKDSSTSCDKITTGIYTHIHMHTQT